MGYILNGKYHKGRPPNLNNLQHSGHKQWDHRRQRKDFAREILQPWDRKTGKMNEDFIKAYPDEAKETYGEN